jgi:hypothetical protein
MDDPKRKLMFFLRALIGEVIEDTKKEGNRGRSRRCRMVRHVREIAKVAMIDLTHEEIEKIIEA